MITILPGAFIAVGGLLLMFALTSAEVLYRGSYHVYVWVCLQVSFVHPLNKTENNRETKVVAKVNRYLFMLQ